MDSFLLKKYHKNNWEWTGTMIQRELLATKFNRQAYVTYFLVTVGNAVDWHKNIGITLK
jgi:predicted NAD-dependent protein-ADP-ribosyltransferase YbiA (DUF1768 family)